MPLMHGRLIALVAIHTMKKIPFIEIIEDIVKYVTKYEAEVEEKVQYERTTIR